MSSSRRAVFTALGADLLLAVAKFAVWFVTGSASLLSEAIHSLADSANQAMLVFGMVRAQRAADPRHPYGYGRERFVWALISAVGVLFVGCGATIAHGVWSLMEPSPIEHPGIAVGILVLALVLEGASLVMGYRAVRKRASDSASTFSEALMSDGDTLAVAVVMEDGAAVAGALVALSALGMTWLTGDPRFDSMGSIAIGVVLGASALFLAHRNRQYLLGVSAPPRTKARVLAVLQDADVVEEVKDVKVTMLGPDAVRVKAEIEFDGRQLAREYLQNVSLEDIRASTRSDEELERFLEGYAEHIVDALGDAVDELEEEIRAAIPEARHVDLETD